MWRFLPFHIEVDRCCTGMTRNICPGLLFIHRVNWLPLKGLWPNPGFLTRVTLCFCNRHTGIVCGWCTHILYIAVSRLRRVTTAFTCCLLLLLMQIYLMDCCSHVSWKTVPKQFRARGQIYCCTNNAFHLGNEVLPSYYSMQS